MIDIDVLGSITNNQQNLLAMTHSDSIDVLPIGIASNHLLSKLASTFRDQLNNKKQKKSSNKEIINE
jgi:hypothetical protein